MTTFEIPALLIHRLTRMVLTRCRSNRSYFKLIALKNKG